MTEHIDNLILYDSIESITTVIDSDDDGLENPSFDSKTSEDLQGEENDLKNENEILDSGNIFLTNLYRKNRKDDDDAVLEETLTILFLKTINHYGNLTVKDDDHLLGEALISLFVNIVDQYSDLNISETEAGILINVGIILNDAIINNEIISIGKGFVINAADANSQIFVENNDSFYDAFQLAEGDNIFGQNSSENIAVNSEDVNNTLVKEDVDTVDFSITLADVIIDLDINSAGAASSPSQDGVILKTLPAAEEKVFEEVDDVDSITGSNSNDVLLANNKDNHIFGRAGNDVIHGFGGNDTLKGGEGDDFLDGGVGDDILIGEAGNDFVFGREGDDILIGEEGDDILVGDFILKRVHKESEARSQGEVFTTQSTGISENYWFQSRHSLVAGEGINTIALDVNGADIISMDTISQGYIIAYVSFVSLDKPYDAGEDTLIGGAGEDTLIGGAGEDTLIGGAGKDTLIGGAGKDTFSFVVNSGFDIITDFESSIDILDVRDFSSDFDQVLGATTQNGNNAFIDFGNGDSLLLENITVEDLSADNFIFG